MCDVRLSIVRVRRGPRYHGTAGSANTQAYKGINRRVILQRCTMVVLIIMSVHMTSAPSNVILGMYVYFAEMDFLMLYLLLE